MQNVCAGNIQGWCNFYLEEGERHKLITWDLNHINSTPFYPSLPPTSEKLCGKHILTQNFKKTLEEIKKIWHPSLEWQRPWEQRILLSCPVTGGWSQGFISSSQCSGLGLLARPSLAVSLRKKSAAPWASLALWQGKSSQLPPTPFLAPLSAPWVLSHLQPVPMDYLPGQYAQDCLEQAGCLPWKCFTF